MRLPSISPLMRPLATRLASRVATIIGLGCLAALAAAIGALFLLLSNGPVSFSWLAPRVLQSLQDIAGPRYGFELKNAAVANTSHGPTLSVDQLLVKYDGRPVLVAPRAQVSVDLASLLVGQIRPRRIEALDLEVRLSVDPDGAVAISAGAEPLSAPPPQVPLVAPPPATDVDAPGLIGPGLIAPDASAPATPAVARATLLRQAVVGLRALMDLATSPQSPIGALDRVGLAHGRLIVDDGTIDRTIRYEDVALALDKGAGGMRFSLSAKGPARRWSALATATGAPGAKRAFHAQLRDLSIDELAFLGGFRNARFDMDAPLGADLDFALGTDNSVLDAGGRFEIGKGFFRLEEPDHEPVMIERIAGEAKWDKNARRLMIAPLRFNAGGFDMTIKGEAHPAAQVPAAQVPAAQGLAAQGLAASGADAWAIALRLDRPTLVVPERAGEKPIRIETGQFVASLLHRQHCLQIDKFGFEGPDAKVDFNGAVRWGKETRVAFRLGVVDTQISALARLWPTHVAAPVRAWFVDHVTSGVVKHGSYTADFDGPALTAMRYERPPPDASALLDADIANGAIKDVLPGMAPVTGVNGQLRVTGRTALFTATSGAIETGPGHRLTLSEGRFSVPDFAPTPSPSMFEARVAGSIDAVADMLALPSIAAHAGLPVDPATLKGQTDGRLRVDFELGKGARPDRIGFSVDANATGISVDRLLGKEKLDNATLHVLADNSHIHVTGQGSVFGAPATLDLRRATGEKAAQAQLALTFDDAARQRTGYAVPGVSGPVVATIRTAVPAAELNAKVDLDLARTTFDNPLPGIVKPPGRAAKASFTLAKRNEGVALEQMSVDAGTAQAQGAIELTKDGGFRAARLSQIRLSPGDDMRVDVTRGADGVKIAARGANFDARPMLQSLLRAGEKAGAKGVMDDIEIDLKSPVVTGHNKQILANVEFRMERRGGKPRALSLTGAFGREPLSVALARNQNGAPQLDISTNDGGSFLAFLDLYRKMDSGALSASVLLGGDNRAEGAMRIRDFYLRGEPTVRQLMAQGGAMRADDRGVPRFDPDLVRIGRLQSDFNWSAGRLALREGVMSGPEIGLTFDGVIDFARDRLDLSGAYVPAYALNSLLSNIPVLGVVLAGGQHEGVFALNYRVTGAMSAPVVNVNPLSAMAPGLLRKIMGVLDGTARAPGGGSGR